MNAKGALALADYLATRIPPDAEIAGSGSGLARCATTKPSNTPTKPTIGKSPNAKASSQLYGNESPPKPCKFAVRDRRDIRDKRHACHGRKRDRRDKGHIWPCHVTQRCHALCLVAAAQPCAFERAGGSILTPRSSSPTAGRSEALPQLDACGARP
jgi:hypothetical protein